MEKTQPAAVPIVMVTGSGPWGWPQTKAFQILFTLPSLRLPQNASGTFQCMCPFSFGTDSAVDLYMSPAPFI